MKALEFHCGDCRAVMAAMPEGYVDAIVTDPPYGLEFMGKEWDAPWENDNHVGRRWGSGFGDVEMADGAKRLRRPSYEKRNNVRCRNCYKWRLSSNPCTCERPDFPNITLANMQAFQQWCGAWATEAFRVLKPGGHLLAFGGTRTYHRLVCAIEDAGFEIRECVAWLYGSGFPKSKSIGKGWGTALKPAHEPVCVARRPLSEPNVAANVVRHGTGALNIDACKIGTPGDGTSAGNAGRWPANVVLGCACACEGDGHEPECAVALLDQQTGTLTSGKAAKGGHRRNRDKFRNAYGAFVGQVVEAARLHGDSGGASRFFYTAKAGRREREIGLQRVLERDRNHHPTVKPIALMRWLCRLVTPPGGLVLDPFMGSGTTGIAALREGFLFIGIEQDQEYMEIARRRVVGDAPLLHAFDDDTGAAERG